MQKNLNFSVIIFIYNVIIYCTSVDKKSLGQNKLHIVHIGTENEPSKSILELVAIHAIFNRSQWPFGLKRGSASALLLGLRVWITQRAWIFFGVFCLVEVTATDRSLVRRSPTERSESECDLEISATRRSRPTWAVELWNKNYIDTATILGLYAIVINRELTTESA